MLFTMDRIFLVVRLHIVLLLVAEFGETSRTTGNDTTMTVAGTAEPANSTAAVTFSKQYRLPTPAVRPKFVENKDESRYKRWSAATISDERI